MKGKRKMFLATSGGILLAFFEDDIEVYDLENRIVEIKRGFIISLIPFPVMTGSSMSTVVSTAINVINDVKMKYDIIGVLPEDSLIYSSVSSAEIRAKTGIIV